MEASSVCKTLSPFLIIVGYVVTIFKIAIPLLLIVFGMLDVGKSVVAGKPDEVTKHLKEFAMRCVAAILIFFIPSIVGVLLDAVAATMKNTDDTNPSAGKESDATGWRCCWDYALGNGGTSSYCSSSSSSSN